MKLGIFDIGLICTKKFSLEVISDTFKTAQKAEILGYTRFWIGEHHDHNAAWRSPQILIALIAANTNSIRIGSAGMLINYHNNLLCAQDYKLLANLFDGRIDLGLARATVADKDVHKLLLENCQPEAVAFNEKVNQLQYLLSSDEKVSMFSPPSTDVFPDLWILGTSFANLPLALEKEINFCLSLCHNKFDFPQLEILSDNLKTLLNEHNSKAKIKSKISIMVNLICAETDEKAQKIASESAHTTLQVNFAGGPEKCLIYLNTIFQLFSPYEIIISDPCKKLRDRIKSLKLISQVTKLTASN